MLNRSPMSRGTGFKRPVYQRVPPSKPTKVLRGVMAVIEQTVIARPKENVLHSASYQASVRQLPCARCGIVGFSQFCHADELKGLNIKTDDRRGWPGCGPHHELPGCHWMVGTSGQLKREERRAAEALYAQRTRAEIMRRQQWPPKLPVYVEKALPALALPAPAAIKSGALP